jgi:hypothetical protein
MLRISTLLLIVPLVACSSTMDSYREQQRLEASKRSDTYLEGRRWPTQYEEAEMMKRRYAEKRRINEAMHEEMSKGFEESLKTITAGDHSECSSIEDVELFALCLELENN